MNIHRAKCAAISKILTVIGGMLVIAIPTHAAEWDTDLGISPRIIYTDNVCLDNTSKRDEWIAMIEPTFNVTADGARSDFRAIGSLQFHTLDDDEECAGQLGANSKSPIPRFNITLDNELVEQFLYLDLFATGYQNRNNPFGPGGDDGLNRSGNVNNTYTYGFNPYINRRIAGEIDTYLSYQWDRQKNSEAKRDDSTRNAASLSIASRAAVGRIDWRLSGSYEDIQYDIEDFLEPDNELISARVTLGYTINRRFAINGTLGKEWNSFISQSPDDEIDGNIWDLGFVWTPHARMTFEAGVGDRFFGATPRFELNYVHKRTTLQASYKRDLTYSRNLRGTGAFPGSVEEPGEPSDPIDSINDGSGFDLGNPTTTSRSPLLDERFTLSYRFRARRTAIGVSGSQSYQTRSEDRRKDRFASIVVFGSRDLSRDLRLDGRVNWYDREPGESDTVLVRDSETWRLGFGIRKQLAKRTSARLDYLYTKRDSEFELDQYTENRITASLDFRL